MIKSIILLLAMSQTPGDTTNTFISPAQIIEQCAEFEADGEYEKAVELYTTISENDTSYLQVQSLLMPNYNSLEQYDKSITIGETIKNQKSNFRGAVYLSLGNAYLQKGDNVSAIKTYKEALQIYPANHIMLYNLALAYHRSQEYETAFSYFQKSAKLNPFYGNNHIMLGYISMLQGHTTKAFLSYMTYLAINPDRNSILVFLNNLATDGVKAEGSIPSFSDNSSFQYYDDLIKSKVALDSRYKHEVDFNANVNKQAELIISKIEFKENTDDFWMDFYIPFYISLKEQKLSTAFVYYILKSSKDEEVQKWIEKHKNEYSDWIDLANTKMQENRATVTKEILGTSSEFSQWFFNNNALSAIGNQLNDDIRRGPWQFYYDNHLLSAEGAYNDEGKKIGEWKFYHENGELNRVETYNNSGVMTKPALYYDNNGGTTVVARYDDENELHGILEYYYPCGQVKETIPYTHGGQNGKGQAFYKSGQLKYEYNVVDGELDSDYISYFQSGQIEGQYIYKDGSLNGDYRSFYDNGQPNEVGQYTNDSLSGDWKGFYRNGKLSYTGSFTIGDRKGEWIYYYESGKLKEVYNYGDNGKLDGEVKYYREEGGINNIETYVDGKLTGYKFFDVDGEVLGEGSDPSGNMVYNTYYKTGERKIGTDLKEGLLNGPYISYFRNGKIHQKGFMIDNDFHGKYEEYYHNGKPYVTALYDSGKLNGHYTTYFKNGRIESEGWYVDGNQEQLWKIYYPDGNLSEERYFISGQLHGWNKLYAANNKVHASFKYDMNEVIGTRQYDSLGNIYHEQYLPFGNGIRSAKSIAGDTLRRFDMACDEFTTDLKYYFPKGKERGRAEMKNGQYNGEYYYKSEIGQVTVKGKYKSNKKEGVWKWYFTNSKQESIYFYKNDLLDGEAKEYYYDGQIQSISDYSKGDLHGQRRYFDQSGNLQLIKFYDRDYGHMAYVNIKTNDTIQAVSKGKFEIKSYFPNGKLAVSQMLYDGKYDGVSSYYNNDGTKIESIEFKAGDYQGKKVNYFSNGKVFIETEYADDLKNGLEKEYYENGKLRRVSPYKNDELNGMVIYYDANGKVESKTYYWNGQIY